MEILIVIITSMLISFFTTAGAFNHFAIKEYDRQEEQWKQIFDDMVKIVEEKIKI